MGCCPTPFCDVQDYLRQKQGSLISLSLITTRLCHKSDNDCSKAFKLTSFPNLTSLSWKGLCGWRESSHLSCFLSENQLILQDLEVDFRKPSSLINPTAQTFKRVEDVLLPRKNDDYLSFPSLKSLTLCGLGFDSTKAQARLLAEKLNIAQLDSLVLRTSVDTDALISYMAEIQALRHVKTLELIVVEHRYLFLVHPILDLLETLQDIERFYFLLYEGEQAVQYWSSLRSNLPKWFRLKRLIWHVHEDEPIYSDSDDEHNWDNSILEDRDISIRNRRRNLADVAGYLAAINLECLGMYVDFETAVCM